MERFAQGLHLVSVELDAGTEGCLKEVGVRSRDAVPPKRVQKGSEVARRVEAPRREITPALFLQNTAIELVVPIHIEGLALGVIVGAG